MSVVSCSTTTTTAYKVTADTTGALVLQTGATPTTAVTIDTSQNIGIGTTSPSQKLEVAGNVLLSNNQYFGVKDTTGAAVGFPIYTGSNDAIFGYLASGSTGISTYQFRVGNNTEVIRINSSGSLLIGATATNYGEKLKITFPNTQGIHLNESTSSSSVNYQYFTKGSTPTNVGAIYYNGSVMAYQTTSDYRLKENIAPMTGALAKIAELKPVTYTWKDNQRDGEGFIAHELQEHFPDAVSGTKDEIDEDGNPKYQGMDASILIATLTAAIQEQQALITQLQADVAALKGKA